MHHISGTFAGSASPAAPVKDLQRKVRIMICDENKPKHQKMIVMDRAAGIEVLLKQAKNKLNVKTKFKSALVVSSGEALCNLSAIPDGTVVAVSQDAPKESEHPGSPPPEAHPKGHDTAPTLQGIVHIDGADSGSIEDNAGDVAEVSASNEANASARYFFLFLRRLPPSPSLFLFLSLFYFPSSLFFLFFIIFFLCSIF